jgi:hypothetical protein
MLGNNVTSMTPSRSSNKKGHQTMKLLGSLLLPGALLLAAAGQPQTFTGVITDSMCGANHEAMHVSPDSKCVKECIKMDSRFKYALYDGKNVYILSDQQTPEKYAAQKVKIIGVLDQNSKTLKVQSIKALK